MQPYQTYYPQINNGYNQQIPVQNPYQQRMDFLQNYQQNLQPTQIAVTNNQMNVMGKIVDSIEAVKAMEVPMDGAMYFFPKADGTEVYGKQWIVNECRTRILTFKPLSEYDPNNLSSEYEKTKIEPFKELTEMFEKRFDDLENRIEGFLVQSSTKTSAKTIRASKKESDENE